MQSPIKKPFSKNKLLILVCGVVSLIIAVVAIVIIANKDDTPATSGTSSSKSKASLGKEYTDATTGLKITPPAGWNQVTPTPTGDVVDFQDNNQDFDSTGNSRPTISVITSQAQGTLAQYADAIESINTKSLKNYKAVAPRDINVDGQPAKILNYTAKVNGHELRNSQLLVIKNNILYGFNGIALVSSWDKHVLEISASFASIKLP